MIRGKLVTNLPSVLTVESLSIDIFETGTATGSREFFSLALASEFLSVTFTGNGKHEKLNFCPLVAAVCTYTLENICVKIFAFTMKKRSTGLN